MYGTRYNGGFKEKAFRLLSARGAVSAVATFSGGGDEGGVDDITLKMPDGTEVALERHWADWRNDKQVPFTAQQEADNELWETLETPVEDKYGSFAGDFHVYGSVTYDVSAKTVAMTGDESTPVSHDISENW